MKNLDTIKSLIFSFLDYIRSSINSFLDYLKFLISYYGKSKKNLTNKDQFLNVSIDSTSLINGLLVGVLFFVLFRVSQTNSLIYYFLEYNDPWATTLLICLFSYTLFFYTRYIGILRREIRVRKNPDYSEVETLENIARLAVYLLPFFFQIYILYQGYKSNVGFCWRSILILTVSMLFFRTLLIFPDDRNSNGGVYKGWIRNVIKILFFLTIALIVIYFYYTHSNEGFDNVWGIGPIDVAIVALIFFRGLFAFIFWVYSITPTPRQLFELFSEDKMSLNYWNIFGLFLFFYFIVFGVLQVRDTTSTYEIGTLQSDMIERVDLVDYIVEWLDDRDSISPIYLVAGQGGGSRAGYWTGMGLAMLDSLTHPQGKKGFYHNCFGISSVSGSSVGAMNFLNSKKAHRSMKGDYDLVGSNEFKDFFTRDYFSSSIVKLLFVNPIRAMGFDLLFTMENRNGKLMDEEAYCFIKQFKVDSSSRYTLDKPLDLIFKDENIVTSDPLLFLNTYNVTKQLKSVISPVKLDIDPQEEFLSKVLNHVDCTTISYGQAVNLSQMFPVLSASANICSYVIDSIDGDYIDTSQYYDGGIYDNSGISTLRDIYKKLSVLRDQFKPDKRIIVLYAENSHSDKVENNVTTNSLRTLSSAAMGSIFSASMKKHRKKLENALSANGDTIVFKWQNSKEVVLNRWLTGDDIDSMQNSLTDITRYIVDSVFVNTIRSKEPLEHSIDLYFNYDVAKLAEDDKRKLKEILSIIDPLTVNLYGYADVHGDEDYNSSLVDKRLDNVKKFLLANSKSLDSDDIDGKNEGQSGERRFLSRQLNRRVNVKFGFYSSDMGFYPGPI